MPTTADWINLGQLGLNAFTGLTGGKGDERTAQRQQQEDELRRALQRYNLQMGARSGLGAFYTQANQDRALGRQSLLNASPLGAEQSLAMAMARARGLSGVAENFQPAMPTSADIAGLIRPTTNLLGAFTTPDFRQAISPEATARSIAERRKALAGVDPTFQFGSMGDYGLPNLEKEVATYAQGVAADRLGRENLVLDLLNQQMKAASTFGQTTPDGMSMQGVPPTQQAAAQPKKTSWWKKVVGAALPVAAAFIPGVGPAASLALQAAAGAAGGALTGGKKGALTGALTGAISAKTGGLGSAAGQRGATETAKEFTKRAILRPSTITNVAGRAIGGQTGAILQAASPYLGGIKPLAPKAGFEGPNLNIIPGPGTDIPDLAAVSPPPPPAPLPKKTMSPEEQQKLLESIFGKGKPGPSPGADYSRNPRFPVTPAPGGGVRETVSAFEAAKVGGGVPTSGNITNVRSPLIDVPFRKRPLPKLLGDAANTFFGGIFGGGPGTSVGAAPQQPRPNQMQTLVRNTAMQQGLDPDLLMAVAGQESAFNPAAVSPKGAAGLLQVMPQTAADMLGIPAKDRTPEVMANLADRLKKEPAFNAALGAQYLKQMLQQFNNDPQLALAAYNAGPGRVRQVVSGKSSLPQETQDYITKILGNVDWSKFGRQPVGGMTPPFVAYKR